MCRNYVRWTIASINNLLTKLATTLTKNKKNSIHKTARHKYTDHCKFVKGEGLQEPENPTTYTMEQVKWCGGDLLLEGFVTAGGKSSCLSTYGGENTAQ